MVVKFSVPVWFDVKMHVEIRFTLTDLFVGSIVLVLAICILMECLVQ